jgi:hypothetical protein
MVFYASAEEIFNIILPAAVFYTVLYIFWFSLKLQHKRLKLFLPAAVIYTFYGFPSTLHQSDTMAVLLHFHSFCK